MSMDFLKRTPYSFLALLPALGLLAFVLIVALVNITGAAENNQENSLKSPDAKEADIANRIVGLMSRLQAKADAAVPYLPEPLFAVDNKQVVFEDYSLLRFVYSGGSCSLDSVSTLIVAGKATSWTREHSHVCKALHQWFREQYEQLEPAEEEGQRE